MAYGPAVIATALWRNNGADVSWLVEKNAALDMSLDATRLV